MYTNVVEIKTKKIYMCLVEDGLKMSNMELVYVKVNMDF